MLANSAWGLLHLVKLAPSHLHLAVNTPIGPAEPRVRQTFDTYLSCQHKEPALTSDVTCCRLGSG